MSAQQQPSPVPIDLATVNRILAIIEEQDP
jgi:hypothetical protein